MTLKQKFDLAIRDSLKRVNGWYYPVFNLNVATISTFEGSKNGVYFKESNELLCALNAWNTTTKIDSRFYSVASSARFVVNAFRNLSQKEVLFEQGLKIKGLVREAQLDAFLVNEHCFIEAKCHEIFDSHKTVDLSRQYNELLGSIGIDSKNLKWDKLTYSDFVKVRNVSTTHFDIKQFVCHLLALVNYQSQESNQGKTVKFYHLFFKPKTFEGQFAQFKNVYDELEQEIKDVEKQYKDIFKDSRIKFGHCYHSDFSPMDLSVFSGI